MPDPPKRLARKLVDQAGAARGDIAARVREVNRVTERGVMGAAKSVGTIADVATASIDSLRAIVGGFEGTDSGGVARAIAGQADRERRFVTDLVEASRRQAESAEAALRTAAELGRAARAIDNLASEAKTLAINSRIEAGRAGTANRAFSVVSDEMRRLSADVATTNTTVRRLSEAVAATLGSVAREAQEMRGRIERFAQESSVGTEQLSTAVEGFRGDTQRALAASDRCLADVVRASHEALSHLQFQDVVAQGLLRLDGRLRDLQVQVAATAGAPEAAVGIADPEHEEVGGDKAVANAAAGEVLLFT